MTEPSICECCHQAVPSPPPSTEHIRPNPENLVFVLSSVATGEKEFNCSACSRTVIVREPQ